MNETSGPGSPPRRVIDLDALGTAKAYFFMISAIVPRPIAWVTTRGRDGSTNLAPFSFFQGVCAAPPTLMISISSGKRSGEPKDTLANIRETGEFVVNVLPHELVDPMVASSAERPYGDSEIEAEGLETFPADLVAPPCLAGSPINMECRLHQEVPIGQCVAVFGRIVRVHAREDVLDARDTVDPDKLRPWARMGGAFYQPYGGVVRKNRPT